VWGQRWANRAADAAACDECVGFGSFARWGGGWGSVLLGQRGSGGGQGSMERHDDGMGIMLLLGRPLSQVGLRRKRFPGQFGQDGMGSIPAAPSTKHASCFPPSSMPASIEISIKLIVCLSDWPEE
jgi:hypothetical protein